LKTHPCQIDPVNPVAIRVDGPEVLTSQKSPAAVAAALEALASIKTSGLRIVILGDMLELGKYSADAHRNAGVEAAHVVDLLITVGFRARAMGTSARDNGLTDEQVRAYEHNEADRAGKELAPDLRPGDIVLVKGSQGIRMEKAVQALMAEPLRAAEFLVRQDSEWLARP
jgi:UDP-N-acetylmuramoyl-tripeptide--D-alanyl-D-alanine ligase